MKVDENKIAYCKKLYLEQQGRDHKLIEKSMREVGRNKALIEEAAAFPKGTNDDQIDAISIAVGMLSLRRHVAMGF